jgi:hypothetical protein
MNAEKPAGKNGHLGKKILYGLVIALSVLIIVVNAALIVGVWAVEQPVSELAVATLQLVENSAKVMQTHTARVDESLEKLQARATVVSVAAEGLRESVGDKGLILTLLPQAREQELADSAESLRDTFGGIRDSVTRGVALYRAINRLPFVNLPTLDDDPAEELATSVDATRSEADSLVARIAEYRAGQAEKVERIEEAATALEDRIQQARDRVARVDSRMAALEARAIALQGTVVNTLTLAAIILSLLLAFVIWTQIEMIRQYSARWGRLGEEQVPQPSASQVLPATAASVPAVSAAAPKPAAKKPKSSRKPPATKKQKRQPAKKK